MRASRERERERAFERVSELARSLAKNLKSSSSRSLARLKIEVAQLALARSRKFSSIFCTLIGRASGSADTPEIKISG
jgi:predicted amidophosphoribosyltransferase